MTLPWPDSYRCIRETLHSVWQVKGEIEILREFSDGRSTARVFAVDIDSSQHRGLAILKLDTPQRWPGEPSEADRHVQATQAMAGYARKHLPTLLAFHEEQGQTALLCSIAGDSFNMVQPLRGLAMEQQMHTIRMMTQGILNEWNKDYSVSRAATPLAILSDWLGYRIHAAQGGQIHEFLQDKCGMDLNSPAFSFKGHWFPNPFSFASSGEFWPSGHEIKVVKGRTHGDLHGHNILVRLHGPSVYDYYLIDLALYIPNSYLFYDFAYFELSHLLHYRGSVSLTRWLDIQKALSAGDPMDVNTGQVEPDDCGLLAILKAQRQEIHQWIVKREVGRKEHIEGQAILARVAAGLNFCNKRVSDRARQFGLLYAAAHLQQYLRAFGLEWERRGAVLDFAEPVQAPQTDEWRDVWIACDHFDLSKNAYCLVSGPNVRGTNPSGLQILGRIPWSLVLDFDSDSCQGGMFEAVSSASKRALHQMLPDNLLDINYNESTCWFMAGGLREREGTLKGTYDSWRRQYAPPIRDLAGRLLRTVSPQPTMVLMLPHGLAPDHLRTAWECLDEALGENARYVVLSESISDVGTLSNKESVKVVKCSIADFMAGLWQMFGAPPQAEEVRIPQRGVNDKERSFIFLSEKDQNYLREDLEIVHGGLAAQAQSESRVGQDFWRGHEVTWVELDMEADVRRELCEPLKEELISKLRESRNISIPLYHTPGAGGTTLAKRVAWDIKDMYPTVRLHSLSQYTGSRIEMLFQKTRLPVLVMMEAAHVPPSARERLYKELRGRNARAVFLYVERSIAPHGRFCLQDPMVQSEANRFCEGYGRVTPDDRKIALRRLVDDDSFRRYCTPFFFGLYAFEKEFVRIPEYVRAHLEGSTEETRRFLCILSLISRYSQFALPDPFVKALLGIARSGPPHLSETLGDGAAHLVLHRDQKSRMVHPLIAEEVLCQALAPVGKNANPDAWKARLVDLSCDMIDTLTDAAGVLSSALSDMVSQMFISRDAWEGRGDKRRHFSELILTIPSEAGQHRILLKLTERFPNDAHVWNHLGRHHIYAMRSNYEEAERCVLIAIENDDRNDIHYHALGMVYRFEINRRLNDLIRQKATAEDSLAAIQDLFAAAEDAFAEARELDPETEHGYVTNIQLITEIIRRLFRLSAARTYEEFLNDPGPVGVWCRERLPWAEELLRHVKKLRALESLSEHTTKCEQLILRCYGHIDALITNLKGLLNRADVRKMPVRRVVADAYLTRAKRDWNALCPTELHTIHILMRQNLEEDPGRTKDLLMWFHAYRRLDEFDMLEAIDRLTGWAHRENSPEAFYYLYILQFLQWRQGILQDWHVVRDLMAKCKSQIGNTERDRPFEWLAREPTWCPLVDRARLGDWNHATRFYANTAPLEVVNGMVKFIRGPQAGTIALGPFDVFFVPGNDFRPQYHENLAVEFYLGFSYDGPRAWCVRGDFDGQASR